MARGQLLRFPFGDLLFHYVFKIFRGYLLSRTRILFFKELSFTIPYPFLVSIDDCGCKFIYDRYGFQYEVDFNVYDRLSLLAREFKTIFPCAFIMKFLDESSVLDSSYRDKLISYIQSEHGSSIEFCFHGYYHELKHDAIGEFALIKNNKLLRVPWEVQFESFNKSWNLMDKLDLPKPKLFIPPYNLWTPKITDNVASKFNVKWLSSPPVFSHGDLLINYGETGRLSSNLYFTPRVIIPFEYDDIVIGWRRRRTVPSISIHNVLRSIEPPHNIMTHIGNYLEDSVYNLIRSMLKESINLLHLYVPRNSYDAFNQWLFYKNYSSGLIKLVYDGKFVRIKGGLSNLKSPFFTVKSVDSLIFDGKGIEDVEEYVEGHFKKYVVYTSDSFEIIIKAC